MSATSLRGRGPASLIGRFPIRRNMVFGMLIIVALLAFELFNYSTTDFALTDLLGDLRFAGIRWATILAIAFCGIDFAGIARLFTPEQGADEPAEVWYLFGAWILGATMNAMLTWWGVSLAILNHDTLGNAVVERGTLLKVVPVFVAIMVWLIRVLIIGTFSVAGERLLGVQSQPEAYTPRTRVAPPIRTLATRPVANLSAQRPANKPMTAPSFRPVQKVNAMPPEPPSYSHPEPTYSRPEPTYHPVSMSGRQNGNQTPRQ